MKEAADLLEINYSTAKTIVQTFRREKRIAKKPKRFLETRKSIQKERYLHKILSKNRVVDMVGKILENELVMEKAAEKKEKFEDVKEVLASGITNATNEIEANAAQGQLPGNGFHYVSSATQLALIDIEEGPKEGQVSRPIGVQQDLPIPACKRVIFYIFPEQNPEEDYKHKVDYEDSVALRPKAKDNSSDLPRLPPLRPFKPLRPRAWTMSIVKDDAFTIDFLAYKQAVLDCSFRM